MSDEKVAILEFKYLQNKKWYKQAVKSILEQGRVTEHTGDFQHLPCFRSIREAPWIQIFVFLCLM